MSKIQLTLTAEHYEKFYSHHHKYLNQREIPGGHHHLLQFATAYPLTLTFELPSPWRTDIENALENGNPILTIGYYGLKAIKYNSDLNIWVNSVDGNKVSIENVTAWMEIPEIPALPERI